MSETKFTYRTGAHWGVTIVEVRDEEKSSERLVATAQTQGDANLIVAALNAYEGAVRP